MTVHIITYHAVSILHGGPRTQITETARHLPSHGVQVRFFDPVSYTHLRAHETVLDLVCRLLLEKKKTNYH